ncbi:GHMP kinase [Methanoculleus taiwanensis]|uniref:Pantoate kinase n=1 Tax=Methanoculleus taiwanensis TaxID=1550565 RepID=A0A498GX40_9EURY|nr:pantoate kinase [Methanoculleus taiwanensis]RXE55389.1 GHMP kinase [Methanoculleus taiwanensis]
MDTTAVAFCPGHISGYFRRVEGDTPATTGSIGAGIVVDEGVRAEAARAETASVTVRRRSRAGAVIETMTGSPPVEYVLERLGVTAAITTECRLPIGAGFGMSAAALLAATTAINRLHNLGLSAGEVAAFAHEAEVVHRTGLGDVAACRGGGFVCRKGPGIDAEIVRHYEPGAVITAVTLGPLSTASVLSSPGRMEAIRAAYPEGCPETLEELFSFSRGFAEKSGLISPEVRSVLAACDEAGVLASMTMLGNGVFAYGEGAEETLAAFGEVFVLRTADRGVHIPEE